MSDRTSVISFPGGVWPVMLTPFLEDGQVDYEGLVHLTDWYIEKGSSGLFAVCQSSEMFHLNLEERIRVAETVVKAAAGRVPVIASGHISDSEEDQAKEINAIAKTGVDAVILITNRLAAEDEDDSIWMERLERLLERIDPEIPLGFYECPYPYKRLISMENLKRCAESGRFYFLKDTCCDADRIKERVKAVEGTNLKLYNANTTTLLETLRAGAAGFSGVMANFHPALYVHLCSHVNEAASEELQSFLTIASLIERQYYPVNAKYHLKEIEKLPLTAYSRKQDQGGLTETFQKEVRMLNELAGKMEEKLRKCEGES
ncbi:MAG: dihydrodipicolinate synthase family protein [Lachnospiraceae bacterium]|nr:dihydrodipicolinate synthase family protein [Lachnospiraceae bacterium]